MYSSENWLEGKPKWKNFTQLMQSKIERHNLDFKFIV